MQFASDAFAKADGTMINLLFRCVTLGALNPIIGGAFSVLIMAYALIGRVIQEDEKAPMTDAEYEQEKRRIQRERELKQLRNMNGQGWLSRGKEALLGQGQDTDEVLEKALSYLRDARELLQQDQEGRALEALSSYLNIKARTVLPVLIQARSIIEREQQEDTKEDAPSEQEDIMNDSTPGAFGDVEDDQGSLLGNLQGRETVPLEVAASVLNCQVKYVIRLRNQGKLKHGSKRPDMITVASLRSYLAATRKKRSTVPTTEKGTAPPVQLVPDEVETGVDKLEVTLAALKEQPHISDEELALLLNLKHPASARFWRLKAGELLKETAPFLHVVHE